jgi:hypothetical protein
MRGLRERQPSANGVSGVWLGRGAGAGVTDDDLDERFTGLPAIALDGAKSVRKTSTARQRANT